MRTVLMIYEKFPPFFGSGSHRPFQFAKYLHEFGYNPVVVGAVPAPGDPVDHSTDGELDGLAQVHAANRLRPLFDSAVASVRSLLPKRKRHVESVPGAPAADDHKPRPKRSTAFEETYGALYWLFYWHMDWALPGIVKSLEVQRKAKADLIWVTAPHTRNLFIGYWVARLTNKPLVLDIRDPWTYGSIWMPKNETMANVERYWARRILGAAQRIVFTSPLTAEEMGRRFPHAADKMRTITNGFADLGEPEPLRLAPTDACVFSYVGSLNPRRSPQVLLEALQLANRDPDFRAAARLQFIGGMAGYDALIDEYGVSNQVVDVGRVTQKDSVRYMCGADVNVLLQTIEEGQDVIAGKCFEYLAARKPILGVCSPTGGDAWLLRQDPSSRVVPFDSPPAVAAAMLDLWRAWAAPTDHGAETTDTLDIERFSRRNLTAQLADLFDEILGPR